MTVRPYLVNGDWRTGEGTLEVKSPFDDSVVAEIGVPTPEDVEEAAATAAATFEGSKHLPVHARADALDLGRLLEGEEGDEVWSLLLLMGRSEEVAEQSIRAEDVALLAKHVFAVAQAFHSYYQKPRYSVLYAESDDLRAFRALVVSAFVRQMEVLLGLLGIPVPEKM